MEYSDNFKNAVRELFVPRYRRANSTTDGILLNNRVYNTFIKISKDSVYFPALCDNTFISPETLENESVSYYPIFESNNYSIYQPFKRIAGFDAALNYITRYTTGNAIGFTTAKGNTYYGSAGCIFDKDFNPVFICGYKNISFDERNLRCTGESPYAKISTKVFLDQEDAINKGIIKKLIPYLLSTPTIDARRRSPLVLCSSTKVEVIITDTFDEIERPAAPKEIIDPKKVQKFLEDNIEDISAGFVR